MKIALLAWGSLIWEKRNLALATDWVLHGPELPIEFSRVSQSRSGALTLVIDATNGVTIPTYVAISSYQRLSDAMDNLGEREGSDSRCVGFVDCKSNESRSIAPPSVSYNIGDWARKNSFDAVIWTDLPSNFDTIDKAKFADIADPAIKFTVDNAQKYLHGLRAPGDEQARTYIRNAPAHVETKLRQRMSEDPWLLASATLYKDR